jgi:outer membrane protein
MGDMPRGTLGQGFGWRWGDSPYVGIDDISSRESDQSSDILPFYYYEGEYLFANGSTAGVHLFDTGTISADALVAYRFDRLELFRGRYFRRVEEREQSLDGGLRGSVRGDWGKLSLTGLTDTLDRHNGEEVDLTYRYTWMGDKWTISPFASYVYWDKTLTRYYYGVTETESRKDLPVYSPGSSTIRRAGVNTSYRLTRRMRLFANLSVDWLGDEITDSPLVHRSGMFARADILGNVQGGSNVVTGHLECKP